METREYSYLLVLHDKVCTMLYVQMRKLLRVVRTVPLVVRTVPLSQPRCLCLPVVPTNATAASADVAAALPSEDVPCHASRHLSAL